MFKDGKRLFEEIKSGNKARCEIDDGSGLRCTITVDSVKWSYVENPGGLWDKHLVLYAVKPQRVWVRIANLTGIDLLRENEVGAAYGVTYADGKKIEVLVDKPTDENGNPIKKEQPKKKGRKKNQQD